MNKKSNKKLSHNGWMKELILPSVVGSALFLGAIGLSVNLYNKIESPQLEQSVRQEEQKTSGEKDIPYQTVCKRYGKSGLAGILAIGRTRDLDPVLKEMYKGKYEEMVDLYDSLAKEYQSNHPGYQPKTFLSSEVVFEN